MNLALIFRQNRYNDKMHRRIYPFFFLLFLSLAAARADTELPAYSRMYDPARDAFADGFAALKLARETNRRVLIELGGDWCQWCHAMDRFLEQNPGVRQQLHRTFVMLKVNVSEDNDNAEFLKVFPAPPGYPHMYVADQDGKLLLSKDTGEFFDNGRYSRERFLAFFRQWQSPKTNLTKTSLHVETRQ